MFSINLYRSFVQICKEGLDLNGHLIHDDQREYHESLRKNFSEMSEKLEAIFGESVSAAWGGMQYLPACVQIMVTCAVIIQAYITIKKLLSSLNVSLNSDTS